jgi:MFS family permease
MSALILPITNPDQYASLPFLLTSLVILFASMAIIAGLVGMYARQAIQAGWLGFAGFVLIFFGMLVVGVGFGLISATVIPWLTTHAPNLLAGELPPVLNVFIIVAILMVVVGTIPLGVATMRAGILPRWAGLLLIVSGVAGLVAIAPLPALVRNILVAVSAVTFFLGLAWIGYALLSERERTVEEVQEPLVAPAEVTDVTTDEVTDLAPAEAHD